MSESPSGPAEEEGEVKEGRPEGEGSSGAMCVVIGTDRFHQNHRAALDRTLHGCAHNQHQLLIQISKSWYASRFSLFGAVSRYLAVMSHGLAYNRVFIVSPSICALIPIPE